MSYFNRFPKLSYDFNREGVVNSVVDIFRQVRPLQNYVDAFSSYRYSNILDGDKVVTNDDGPSSGDKYVDIDGGNVGVNDGRSDGY